MKKFLLTLMIPIIGSHCVYSQAEITHIAPTGAATTGLRAPNGTTAHTTVRGVIIVTAAELAAIPNGTILSKLGFVLSSGATPGPAGGNIQMYLENTADVTNLKSTTWATTISTMTSVYNGSYSIPAAAGNVDLTLSTPFTYTGGSLYVAYDYLGSTFTTTGSIYSANNTLAGGWKGQVDATTTPPATISSTSAFRPNIRFTYANPFVNELSVTGVAGEKGIFNNTISQQQTVTSLISNTSSVALTNIPVTLTITGANPYSISQVIPSISAGSTSTLLFTGIPTINLGSQTITVSIPSDEVNTNNSLTFNQQVQCDTIGYVQTPVPSGGVGFGTGSGLIAVRHTIPNNIETFVKSVSNYFPSAASSSGNTMKGILLDGNGVILDSTAIITITAGMLGTKQNFDFINGAIDVSGGDIYVGFRQDANATTPYFPFANQNNSYVDPNAAATFYLFGGPPAPLGSSLGYMMIEAVLTYGGFDVPNSSTAGDLCFNSQLTISPTVGYSNYEFFIDGSSVQNGSSSSYTSTPLTAGVTYNVNITNGACTLNSNVQSISITSQLVNTISADLCSGQTYTFGSQTLNNGGFYSDTLTSVSGCDSIINLTLTTIQPTSSNLSVSICQGETYTLGTQNLTTAGVYTEVIPNAVGCDSTITLTLTVNNPSSSTITLSLCDNNYQFGTQTLNSSGTYVETFSNSLGCDSIVTLNLTLNSPISVTASATGVTINTTATSAVNTYQWIDCATENPIVGENSSSFNPTVNGSYAVIVDNTSGCVDTSNCVTINSIGIDELSFESSISLYPNPSSTTITASSSFAVILSYKVVDINGRLIQSTNTNEGTKEIEFSVLNFENGVYFLEMNTVNGSIVKAFVKK